MIRKIRFMLIVIVAIFMVSFIPNVYAEDENYYELKFYEKNTLLDGFSELELDLMDFLASKEDLLQPSGDYPKVLFYNLDNKLLFTLDYSGNPNGNIDIDDKVTFQDNIEYKFTNDEKVEMTEHYPELSDYSGVKWMLVEEPEEPKECNSVCIESVVLDSKSDQTEIISKPKYQDLTVKFDIKFKELNDYVKYKIVINNATNEDYMISEKSNFGDSQYITYEYSYEGSNKVAKKNSKTVMYITIKYNQKVPDEKFNNGIFTETNNLVIALGNDKGALDAFKNPNTGHNLLAIGIILLTILGLFLVLYKTTNKKKYLSLFIIGLIILPISIYAIEKFQINVDSKIQISKLRQFSFYSGCTWGSENYYNLYRGARHYQYEEGMTWQEWLASEYSVGWNSWHTPIYVSPELIECHKQLDSNYSSSDLRACENKFGPQPFNPASLIVSEGLYYFGYGCGN